MSYLFSLHSPLHSIMWSRDNSFIKQLLALLFGVLILAVASQLSIPLVPVPLTFQSATAILIGMTYGARNGALVILAYYVAGIVGFPVFADYSAGIHQFFGQTGGYLIGFLPAAFISGYLAERGFARYFISSFIAACLGTTIIFASGLLVLSQFIGFDAAIKFGLLPFIITEPVKIIVLGLLAPKCWQERPHP